MSWDMPGKRVKGVHNGVEFTGRVLERRVKYGGTVQLTVKLAVPMHYRWRDEAVDTILVDANTVSIIPG